MKAEQSSDESEDGSVVIWVAVLCTVCMIVAISIGKLGNATRSIALAQNAADASALSAAYDIAHSVSENACDSASTVALKNGAKVLRCEFTNDAVEVEIQLLERHDITAKARAEVQ